MAENSPRKRSIWAWVIPILFGSMMVARTYLARQEREERERMFRSLAENQREFDREFAARERKRLNDAMLEDSRRNLEKLEEIRQKLEVPKPLDLSTAPIVADPTPAEPERPSFDWATTAHSFYVTHADLAAGAVESAWGVSIADGAKKKALGKRLRAIHGRLVTALGNAGKFPESKAVRAELAEAEACDLLIDAALAAKGPHRKMAHENLGDFITALKSVPE